MLDTGAVDGFTNIYPQVLGLWTPVLRSSVIYWDFGW